MDIHYKIHFFTDWHCGSGLAAGADTDMLVIKDRQDMPYIPGKTIKGLVKEALEDIKCFRGDVNDELYRKALGYFDNKETAEKGECFFTNAILEKNLQRAVFNNNLQEYFYRTVSSTSINEEGIAEPCTLRRMQTTIPCDLYGMILDVPREFDQRLKESLLYIKRLGQNRNRGLGRCVVSVIEGGEK